VGELGIIGSVQRGDGESEERLLPRYRRRSRQRALLSDANHHRYFEKANQQERNNSSQEVDFVLSS